MRISDWSSDVCSSDLSIVDEPGLHFGFFETPERLHLKDKALNIDLPSSGLDILWHPLQEHLLDKLGEQLLSHVAAHKVKRLFIDGLGGFERAALQRPRLLEFLAVITARAEERRGGKECVSKCRSR